jgi:hypothetical protein
MVEVAEEKRMFFVEGCKEHPFWLKKVIFGVCWKYARFGVG